MSRPTEGFSASIAIVPDSGSTIMKPTFAMRQLRMGRCRLHVWQIQNAVPNY
jgi:hypothetical protein